MLNQHLDLKTIAKAFRIDKRVMIHNFLNHAIAERMHNGCKDIVPYASHYVLDNKYQSKTRAELAALSPQESKRINQQIMTSANKGIGFVYEGYLKTRRIETVNIELQFLHDMFDYICSEDVIQTIKQITGNHNIRGAEPQYTRFTPGQFLTRHLDIIPGKGRLYAFVLGLTKVWHPDWGGLLQFYQKDGTPRDAWIPQFNVLSIFDVSHVHSVTYVTPFASEPRLSMTGWFVGDE